MCAPGNACGCGGTTSRALPLLLILAAALVVTGLAAVVADIVYALLIGAVLAVAGSLAVLVMVLRRPSEVMWRPGAPLGRQALGPPPARPVEARVVHVITDARVIREVPAGQPAEYHQSPRSRP